MTDNSELDAAAWEAAVNEIARVRSMNRKLVPGDLVVIVTPTASLGDRGVVEEISGSDTVRLRLDGNRAGTFSRSSLMSGLFQSRGCGASALITAL